MRDILRKIIGYIQYILYLVVVVSVLDVVVLKHILGHGYARHYEEENIERYPAPYVAFTGKPNVKDHNQFGFRGQSFRNARANDLKIAFFGGSTGYYGDPTIAGVLQDELIKLLGLNVFVANYSVVSSNHRQHLHGLIEYLPQFSPDLVIFYGGYNETVGNGRYDPRPGYPYNFFYRSETSPLTKLLLENSAVVGDVDKKFGIFTGLNRLREEQQPFSDDWNKRIVDKYFETLDLAANVAGTIASRYCGRTRFLAYYQPYQVPQEFESGHEQIRARLIKTKHANDVSTVYDSLGKGIWLDIVHVNQAAGNLMGKEIAASVARNITAQDGCAVPSKAAALAH